VALPLILQIQQSALNNSASLADALLKAKVVCFKLGLTEFGMWVDSELDGYMDGSYEELPEYRKLYGEPQYFNPYYGWQPITFGNAEVKQKTSLACVGMTIGAIERSLRDTDSTGEFSFSYPPDVEIDMQREAGWQHYRFRIKLTVPQCATIVEKVRNILLTWTLEMEKQGVLGNDLVFNEGDKEKSAQITESAINNIQISHVGSFVQNASYSVVQGEVYTSSMVTKGVHDLAQQVDRLLPTSDLPEDVQSKAKVALQEVEAAGREDRPDAGRLRRGLESLKRALAPAGEHVLSLAVDAAITKFFGPGQSG